MEVAKPFLDLCVKGQRQIDNGTSNIHRRRERTDANPDATIHLYRSTSTSRLHLLDLREEGCQAVAGIPNVFGAPVSQLCRLRFAASCT